MIVYKILLIILKNCNFSFSIYDRREHTKTNLKNKMSNIRFYKNKRRIIINFCERNVRKFTTNYRIKWKIYCRYTIGKIYSNSLEN